MIKMDCCDGFIYCIQVLDSVYLKYRFVLTSEEYLFCSKLKSRLDSRFKLSNLQKVNLILDLYIKSLPIITKLASYTK
jgi:hypothetical protein